MKPNILDLREERCPMALLLAKRYAARLENGQSLLIYISDMSSMKDIVSFLSQQAYSVEQKACSDFHQLQVIKKEVQSNA